MSGLIWTPPGRTLPGYPLEIDRASPLARSLVRVVQLGGAPSVDRVDGSAITLTGTRPAGGPFGPARGFSTTYGGATSDRAAVALSAFAGARSHLVVFFQNGGGGSTAGRLFDRAGKERLNYTNVAANPLYYGLVNTGTTDIGVTFSGVATYGKRWNVLVGTMDQPTAGGAVTFQLWLNGIAQALTVSGSSSGTVGTDAGSLVVGNRNDGTRVWDGSVALVAVWDRLLTEGEALTLSRDPGLLFHRRQPGIWTPTAAAASHAASGVLAGQGATLTASAAHAATHVASGALAGPGATLAASAAHTAAAHAASGALAGAGATLAASAAHTAATITIESPADRGTLDLASCSVTPNGSTPTISLKNRYIGDANTTGARFTFGRVTGVAGMTPTFDVDRSNMELVNASANFYWSYTGDLDDWTEFTTTTLETTPNVYRSTHGSAFAQDTVYIASNLPWPVGYTLLWIQSLESSGLVSEAPSAVSYSGDEYQFETRTATTNGSTSGAGDAIAAQPLYAFRIGGTGNAPDGLPKRKMALLSGVHAAEDVGNYLLKGAVEFLVSADSQAATRRDWFEIIVYPVVASAGRAGGGQRNDFENAAKTADVNRNWTTSSLETNNKHKTAITADLGATIDALFDFHGSHITSETLYDYYAGRSQARWTTAIQTYRAALDVRTQTTASTSNKWAVDAKSAAHSLNPEHQYHAIYTQADAEDYGADHMRAVADLIAAGEFGRYGTGALTGQGASLAGSATRTATTLHAGSGALAGQGAAIGASAVHRTLHTAAGVLSGGNAIVIAAAAHRAHHAGSGALAGQGASVAASAAHSAAGEQYLALEIGRYRDIAERIWSGELPATDGADMYLRIGLRRRLNGME